MDSPGELRRWPGSSWPTWATSPTPWPRRQKVEELQEKLKTLPPEEVADRLQVGVPTVRDIFDALARPGRDPREDLPPPIFKKGILKLEDLQPGMELKGTVLNVVDFGAFIDIGLKDSGLVHISQMANRYVKSPYDVVAVGDVVNVWVLAVDKERHRVSLTMIQPGSERRPPDAGPRSNSSGANSANRARAAGDRRTGTGPVARPGQPAGPPRVESRPPQGGGGGPPRGPARRRRGRRPRSVGLATARPMRARLAAARHQRLGWVQQAAPAAPSRGARADPGCGTGRSRPRRRPAQRRRPASSRRARASGQSPPPRLSQAALSGKEPLSTFGELAALFQAREQDEPAPTAAPAAPTPEASQTQQSPPPADSQTPPA